jgi:hypothetical protein
MLRICDHPDCATLTLGAFCIEHEQRIEGEIYPRGRPFPQRGPSRRRLVVAKPSEAVKRTPARAVSLGGGTAAA